MKNVLFKFLILMWILEIVLATVAGFNADVYLFVMHGFYAILWSWALSKFSIKKEEKYE